jgi:adenine phosphoribosyltransferase
MTMELVQLYRGQTHYSIEICGIHRKLPLRKVDEDTWVASNHVVIFGDVELVEKGGKELSSRLFTHDIDIVVTAEAKAEALAYEVTKSLRLPYFIVCRKQTKSYMKNPLTTELKSITTEKPQALVLDQIDANKIRGKNVVLVDDVVTTGGNMNAMERLVAKAGGKIKAKACVWIEGIPLTKAAHHARENLVYLGYLPIFYAKDKYKEVMLGKNIKANY